METWPEVFQFFRNILKNQFQSCDKSYKTDTETSTDATPHLWTDLVKNFTRKQRHALSFSLECTDFKNVITNKLANSNLLYFDKDITVLEITSES